MPSKITDEQLEQAIHKSVKASNKEQKELVDRYDRIQKHLKAFDNIITTATEIKELRQFYETSLINHEQEVRKEVLEELSKNINKGVGFGKYGFSRTDKVHLGEVAININDIHEEIINSMK